MAPSRQIETMVNQIVIVMACKCAAMIARMHLRKAIVTGQTVRAILVRLLAGYIEEYASLSAQGSSDQFMISKCTQNVELQRRFKRLKLVNLNILNCNLFLPELVKTP